MTLSPFQGILGHLNLGEPSGDASFVSTAYDQRMVLFTQYCTLDHRLLVVHQSEPLCSLDNVHVLHVLVLSFERLAGRLRTCRIWYAPC